MVHLWAAANVLIPNPHSPIPASADKLCAGPAPVTAHHRRYVTLVYLGRRGEGTNVEGVEIMIFRCQEKRGGESGAPGKRVRSHLRVMGFSLRQCTKEVAALTFITTLLSAFPVRMSYSVNVRSEPVLARMLDSERLKRTEVMVSTEVGNVRLETGADLSEED